jgi:hypothetical protein
VAAFGFATQPPPVGERVMSFRFPSVNATWRQHSWIVPSGIWIVSPRNTPPACSSFNAAAELEILMT